jgi:TolB-like protein/DNA-binding winged helix-turn-helix (wHTH) protein
MSVQDTVPTSIERLPAIRFGEFKLDRHSRELSKPGQCVRLQEQPFKVLALLLERAGEVVTRDEMRQRLWPSSVYVDFDHGLNNAITRLREALGEEASKPAYIETLPRLGYRFIHPLASAPGSGGTALSRGSDASANIAVDVALLLPGVEPHRRKSSAVAAAAIAAAVFIALGILIVLGLRPSRVEETQRFVAVTNMPSIAVLPFVNLSPDEESEYFADGLTQELLDKLAGTRGLKVVGRTSSFHFKNKQEPLPVIAQALKVNHLLEGSVQRSGTRLRITAQLVNADGGAPLWSQTFDRDSTDIFQTEEDIAIAVATALQLKLLDADEQRLRRRGTQDPEAYRLYVMANAHLTGITVKRDLATAKRLYEEAIARDPNFAAAHARLAYYHFYRAWASFDDVTDGVVAGMAAAERAIALNPESSEALQARANFEMWRYRFLGDYNGYVEANNDYRRAIQLDPANDTAFFDFGRAVLWHEPDLAQELFERTVELEPLRRRARDMAALALSIRGLQDVARERLRVLGDPVLARQASDAVGAAILQQYFGHLDEAVSSAQAALMRGGLELPIQLWGLYMSLGDREAAKAALNFGDTELASALSTAASLTMRDRYEEAFEFLDSQRGEFERSRILDLPAARLALIVGKPAQALAIMEQRLPDLVAGIEPVNARNAIPALDLVAAWAAVGERTRSRALLDQVAVFLDGPAAPRLPLFTYLRARTHVLAGESELAVRALDRAYQTGFRTTWAQDLHPHPYFYIDCVEVDPAFAKLRLNFRYQSWLARMRADNARQLERLRTRAIATPAA